MPINMVLSITGGITWGLLTLLFIRLLQNFILAVNMKLRGSPYIFPSRVLMRR